MHTTHDYIKFLITLEYLRLIFVKVIFLDLKLIHMFTVLYVSQL